MCNVPAAIAAREREVAERERGAAASAFLESLDLPAPAAMASPVATDSIAAPDELAIVSASAPEAAGRIPLLEDMTLGRVRTASPALSGGSRRSSASRKRAAPEPSRLQDASHDGAVDQQHDAAPFASAVTALEAATQDQLQAELAVIQVRSFCLALLGFYMSTHHAPGYYVVLYTRRPEQSYPESHLSFYGHMPQRCSPCVFPCRVPGSMHAPAPAG